MTVNAACEHKIADHEHGTYACYVLDRCRCVDCVAANRDYERHRSKWLGEFPRLPEPYVDADAARKVVDELKQRGMGLKTIAARSGVAHGTLWKLVYGKTGTPSKRCRPATLEKLEACLDALIWEEAPLADGAKVDGQEARLIVKELVARGWAKAELGRRIHGPHALSLQAAESPLVEVRTLRILRELMCEPVPMRVHNPTGRFYAPKPNRKPRGVARLVDGVGGPVFREPVTLADRIVDLLDLEGWMSIEAMMLRLDATRATLQSTLGRMDGLAKRYDLDGKVEWRLA